MLLGQLPFHAKEKMSALKFSEFYAPIRAHFSSNIWEYEKFKRCKDNGAKVEFLMGHSVVQKSWSHLAESNSQIPLCSIFGAPQRNEKKAKIAKIGNAKYPQLSKKVEVKVTKKKGRMLVAKEKIEPGKYHCANWGGNNFIVLLLGEVIIHEKPYCTLLYAKFRPSHCNSCFVRITNEPVTCPHCKEVHDFVHIVFFST